MIKKFKENIVLVLLIVSLLFSNSFTDVYILPKEFYILIFISVFLVLYSIWLLVFNKEEPVIKFDIVDFLFLLYAVYIFIQYLLVKGFSNIEQEIIIAGYYFVFYFFIKQVLVSKTYGLNLYYLLPMILIFPFLQAIYGFLEYSGIVSRNEFFDIGGSYGNPGAYTNFLIASYPLAFGLLIFNNKSDFSGWHWFLILATFIFVTLILPLSHSRTAWISAFTCITFLLLFKYQIFQKLLYSKYKWIIMISLSILLVFSMIQLYQYKKDSSSGRLFIWELSLKSISENPIFGKGFNTFIHSHNIQQANYFKSHPDDIKTGYLADNIIFSYNDFLNIGVETGLTGLLLFLAIIGVIIFLFIKERKNYLKDKGILVPVFFSFLIILMSALFSYPFRSIPVNLYFLLFLAILSSGLTNKRKIISICKQRYKVLALFLLIISVVVLQLEIKRCKSNLKWGEAAKYIRTEKQQNALAIYKEIYSDLRYNSNFLYNYGAELSLIGQYQKSIELLKECEQKLNDADVYTYLGNSYEGIGMVNEAEKSFEQASYIIPHKLYPKYRLVYLYANMNQIDKALEMANKVLKMKPKIESDITRKLKIDIQHFIKSVKENHQ